MSLFRLCTLILAAIQLSAAGIAHAQAQNPLSPLKGLWNAPDYDAIYNAERIDEFARRELLNLHKAATEALDAKNYAAAEAILGELVRRNPTTTDAHFLMGLAKIGLGRWGEAKPFLEAAVAREPRRPEPKTRLGLTHVRLGDIDAARKVRADLASLAGACATACEDAIWIADGLLELDGALAAPAAQAPRASLVLTGATGADSLPASPAPAGVPREFDPAEYSLVTFDDPQDLYDLLTKDGRCAPEKTAEHRQPCALILYRPVDGAEGGITANFKPVFRVDSRRTIWAIHDKKLQKVRIENLFFDVQDIIGQKRKTYESVALIGNAENRANCEKALPCLSGLVAEDMFRMYGNMPDSVVEVIWGAGMKDPGTIRVR